MIDFVLGRSAQCKAARTRGLYKSKLVLKHGRRVELDNFRAIDVEGGCGPDAPRESNGRRDLCYKEEFVALETFDELSEIRPISEFCKKTDDRLAQLYFGKLLILQVNKLLLTSAYMFGVSSHDGKDRFGQYPNFGG